MDIIKEYISYDLHTFVDIVGTEKFLEICKMYGGSTVYIPVYKKATMGKRNKDLIMEYNGKNIDSLRIKYGISRQQIKTLLKAGGVL